MSEIVEYVTYVDPVMPAADVPKYPVPKESHFNFLKPGSKEVLTRPVHIHEHLPPINPPEDEPLYNGMNGEKEIDVVGVPCDDGGVFKRPPDGGLDSNTSKKIKMEEEGRPTREISSVMMTTSGFISPAREGKLPESKPPNLPPEFPKPVSAPMMSPPFKAKDSLAAVGPGVDKKLEKKLKKKREEKEKRKEKPVKEKSSIDVSDGGGMPPLPPTMMPREANEQMMMLERKKALKKLKMKNKEPAVTKKKKEKPPKLPKQHQHVPFDSGFLEKSKFEPVLPPAPSQIQAHNFLTGAAHLFPPDVFSSANPFVEGKLITEPDKNKLNIFKKISKPKEDPVKPPPQVDFFQMNQPSTSQQQVYNDPMKKVHKLPRETTMTRVDDAPINFSMSRSHESSFEELAMPKTPTIPRTPDLKMSQGIEKKEKKERKKKERKVEAPDWNPSIQNPFMPEGNPFLQTLQNAAPGLMGNLGGFQMRNPFSLPTTNELFPSGPGLIPRAPFGMGQFGQVGQMNQMNQMMQNAYGFPLPGMDMNLLQQSPTQQHQPKPKKVKAPKHTNVDYPPFNNSLLMPPTMKERFDAQPLMNVDAFPLQHHQQPLSSFDQLLHQPQHHAPPPTLQPPPKKIIVEEKMETFDLTSSPEPMTPAPEPPILTPAPIEVHPVEQVQPVLKEKSKEKKKKKDKDKEKGEKGEKGDKEDRKKVSVDGKSVQNFNNLIFTEKERKEKEERKAQGEASRVNVNTRQPKHGRH